MSEAEGKNEMGREFNRGLGGGSDPEVGREAAETGRAESEELVAGADMVFITAGEGGGTGTGAAPVIAEISRAAGALTVGIVTRPFNFEGRRRALQAEAGISKLREKVDTLIVIPNERLLAISSDKTSLLAAFASADQVLLDGVVGITGLIMTPGLINTDFADVKMILKNAGTSLMGIGRGTGDNRATVAANAAINSPLLESSVEGARGILLNISGPSDLGLFVVITASAIIHPVSHPYPNTIFVSVIAADIDDIVKLSVFTSGFVRVLNILSRPL